MSCPAASGVARIEHLTPSGTFSLDGGTWAVENNVWIVGDDHIGAAPALAELTGAPILLHPDDRVLWDMSFPDSQLGDGHALSVAWASRTPSSCTPGTARARPSARRRRRWAAALPRLA